MYSLSHVINYEPAPGFDFSIYLTDSSNPAISDLFASLPVIFSAGILLSVLAWLIGYTVFVMLRLLKGVK